MRWAGDGENKKGLQQGELERGFGVLGITWGGGPCGFFPRDH